MKRPAFSPAVVLLTGLSGSGKTTLAGSVADTLKKRGILPVIMDGDDIRSWLQVKGFDAESRKEHNLAVGRWAALLESQGHIVLVALIAPFAEVRNQIRSFCRNFIEVHLCTSLEVCRARDTKGLYQKASSGELKEFTGISAPYFAPENPELKLDTALLDIDECTERILEKIMSTTKPE